MVHAAACALIPSKRAGSGTRVLFRLKNAALISTVPLGLSLILVYFAYPRIGLSPPSADSIRCYCLDAVLLHPITNCAELPIPGCIAIIEEQAFLSTYSAYLTAAKCLADGVCGGPTLSSVEKEVHGVLLCGRL